MSWIDIFLTDGGPNRSDARSARESLAKMLRLRELPALWLRYRRGGLALRDQLAFLTLDVVRGVAYRRGFRDGERRAGSEGQR